MPYPFKFWTLLAFSSVTFRFDRLKQLLEKAGARVQLLVTRGEHKFLLRAYVGSQHVKKVAPKRKSWGRFNFYVHVRPFTYIFSIYYVLQTQILRALSHYARKKYATVEIHPIPINFCKCLVGQETRRKLRECGINLFTTLIT